jgi:hypothetical protein
MVTAFGRLERRKTVKTGRAISALNATKQPNVRRNGTCLVQMGNGVPNDKATFDSNCGLR